MLECGTCALGLANAPLLSSQCTYLPHDEIKSMHQGYTNRVMEARRGDIGSCTDPPLINVSRLSSNRLKLTDVGHIDVFFTFIV